jgi:long-chain acyl-CoA synthetase
MLEGAMARFADRPAFRCCGQTFTYADTDRLSRQFAAYLQAKLGVKKGDRIGVMLPNIPAFPLATLGVMRAGAVQVNINPLYTPRELEHQLNDAGVQTIVIFNGVSSTLAEIIDHTKVKQVISVASGDGAGATLPDPPVDARLNNVITFSDALAEGAGLSFTPVPLSGEDLASTVPAEYRNPKRLRSAPQPVANTEQSRHSLRCHPSRRDVIVTALRSITFLR